MNIKLLKPGQVWREGNITRPLGDCLLLCTIQRKDDGKDPSCQEWIVMRVKTGYIQTVKLTQQAQWYLVA